MEKSSPATKDYENLSDEDLGALRAKLAELAADLPGTLAMLPEDVQSEYREAEASVIHARTVVHGREGLITIY